ncbi:MAG: RNA-binding protein [Balneolales bacterium]
MDIYIGNLAWKTKRSELQELFENFGEVTKAFIVRDRKTRRSKGFGFVEMADKEAASTAIEALNNTEFLERTIIVNEAKPKNDKSDNESTEAKADNEDTDDRETVVETVANDESKDQNS